MPKHTTTDPNRVADLVKGGGLKPDKLKKRELLSLIEVCGGMDCTLLTLSI